MHYALKNYGANLNWNVGSLFCHDEMLFNILELCRRFSIDHPIKWAFGCISSPMASGMAVSKIHSVKTAIAMMEQYIERGIACRLALTNPHADLKMIGGDTINQELMKFLNSNSLDRARHGVVLASDVLAEYVKEAYPNLDVVLSVIRPAYDVGYGMMNDTLDWYVEKLENALYDYVGVNNAKLHEDGFMESLPFKEKVELIACRDCMRNCPYTKYHFEAALGVNSFLYSLKDVEKPKLILDEVNNMCIETRRKHLDQASSYTTEEITKLTSFGYRNFQISSRRNLDCRFARDVEEYLFVYKHLRYLQNLM